MTKPLLVGIANPYAERPSFAEALYPAPEGSTGYRLWQMIHDVSGMSQSDYLERFARTNLDEPALRQMAADADVILPLGETVWAHFGLSRKSRPFDWVIQGDKRFAYVPHPSKRNLWYNSAENRRLVGEFLVSLVD
jgi:hypothetical protein